MRLISAGSLVQLQSRPPAFARSEAESEAAAPQDSEGEPVTGIDPGIGPASHVIYRNKFGRV